MRKLIPGDCLPVVAAEVKERVDKLYTILATGKLANLKE